MQEAVQYDRRSKKGKIAPLVSATAKLLFTKSQKMNALAKVNGIRLRLAGVPKSVVNILNHTADCVSYDTITKLLDSYADQSTEVAKQWQNLSVVHAGDNVDVRSHRRHESSSKSSMDMHFYNSITFKSRVNFSFLSDIPPVIPQQFTMDHLRSLLPASSDYELLIQQLSSIVAEEWSSVDSEFSKYIVTPQHQFSEETSTKSEMVSFEQLHLKFVFVMKYMQ